MSPLIHILCATVLFIAFSPGVLFSFPKRGSMIRRVLVHALIFAIVLYGIYAMACYYEYKNAEGFTASTGKLTKDTSNNSVSTTINLNGTKIPLTIKTLIDGTFSLTSDENIIIDILKNPSNYFTDTSGSIAMSSIIDVSGESVPDKNPSTVKA